MIGLMPAKRKGGHIDTMKGGNRIGIFAIALLLLVPCGTYLYRQHVYNKIADLGGMENVLPDPSEPIDKEIVHSFTYALDANPSTGYEWKAMIADGNSVSVDEYGYYRSNPNPEMADGVGGTQYFKMIALKPGASLLHFVYSRGEDDIADAFDLIVTVDEQMQIAVQPADESFASEHDASK